MSEGGIGLMVGGAGRAVWEGWGGEEGRGGVRG